jgi:hypothetical protein
VNARSLRLPLVTVLHPFQNKMEQVFEHPCMQYSLGLLLRPRPRAFAGLFRGWCLFRSRIYGFTQAGLSFPFSSVLCDQVVLFATFKPGFRCAW